MWSLLLISTAALATIEVKAQTLSGTEVSGTLVELSSEQLVVRSPRGEERLAVTALRSVIAQGSSPAAVTGEITVQLSDGSVLRADTYRVRRSIATLGLAGGGTIEMPTRLVRSVLLRPLGKEELLQQQWQDMQQQEISSDVIAFRRSSQDGDALTLDQLEGILYDVDDARVTFEIDGQRAQPSRAKLAGLIYFHPAQGDAPPAVCRVLDRFGSVWKAKSLTLSEGKLQLVSVGGLEYALPLDQMWQLDYSTGNLAYLSDLQPDQVEWRPYLASRIARDYLLKHYQPRHDESFAGGPLQLGQRSYLKGMAIHSRTRLVYRLTEPYQRFQAIVGIDDRVRNATIPASVRLIISSDKKTLFDQRITGEQEPLPLDLDIRGVRRLTILVDFDDQWDIADHLNLCEARITK